jgi:hypothetical protein
MEVPATTGLGKGGQATQSSSAPAPAAPVGPHSRHGFNATPAHTWPSAVFSRHTPRLSIPFDRVMVHHPLSAGSSGETHRKRHLDGAKRSTRVEHGQPVDRAQPKPDGVGGYTERRSRSDHVEVAVDVGGECLPTPHRRRGLSRSSASAPSITQAAGRWDLCSTRRIQTGGRLSRLRRHQGRRHNERAGGHRPKRDAASPLRCRRSQGRSRRRRNPARRGPRK